MKRGSQKSLQDHAFRMGRKIIEKEEEGDDKSNNSRSVTAQSRASRFKHSSSKATSKRSLTPVDLPPETQYIPITVESMLNFLYCKSISKAYRKDIYSTNLMKTCDVDKVQKDLDNFLELFKSHEPDLNFRTDT
jgi:hypothetical protein